MEPQRSETTHKTPLVCRQSPSLGPDCGVSPSPLTDREPASLTDPELLCVVSGLSDLDLADAVLERSGGLSGLSIPDTSEVAECQPGLERLGAALELARRLMREEIPSSDPLRRPDKVAAYLRLRFARRDQEVMGALFVDTRSRLIGERVLFCGTLNRAAVEPRPLLRAGLMLGAAALIAFHTHPSGDPAPSREDLGFTERLRQAGEVVGIRMIDHLVLGHAGCWISLRDRLGG